MNGNRTPFGVMLALLFGFCLISMGQGQAQEKPSGFAGLGQSAQQFEQPSKTTVLTFPRDHAAHRNFRIEWWYVTANLQLADGTPLGAQWTLFRSARRVSNNSEGQSQTGWADPQLWLGHAALTTSTRHVFSETRARGNTGQAGVSEDGRRAWIDDWQLASNAAAGGDLYDDLEIRATGETFSYTLNLSATGPLIFHGDRGYSVKSPLGQASHYYSQPFFQVSGSVEIDGKTQTVTGMAWLDREWSSQPLSENQSGWDWASLHFADRTKLMIFQVRSTRNGEPSTFLSGTFISADGETAPLSAQHITLSALGSDASGPSKPPTRWAVDITHPKMTKSFEIIALNPNSFMRTSIPYWEGPVRIHKGASGVGYLEMTGY